MAERRGEKKCRQVSDACPHPRDRKNQNITRMCALSKLYTHCK